MRNKNGLSAKRQKFCDFYTLHFCAAKAARLAGYAENSAKQQGYQMLQDERVQAEIRKIQADLRTRFAGLPVNNTLL